MTRSDRREAARRAALPPIEIEWAERTEWEAGVSRLRAAVRETIRRAPGIVLRNAECRTQSAEVRSNDNGKRMQNAERRAQK